MPSITHDELRSRSLSSAQVEHFIQDGFVRIDGAFPRELADEARIIMWRDLPCDPSDRATWTRPVIRLPEYKDQPFRKAVNTPVLHAAFDQLASARTVGFRARVSGLPGAFSSS